MFGRSSRSQDQFFAGLDPAQILDSLRSTRDTMLEDIDDVDPIPRARLPGSRDRLLAASQEDGFMGFIVDPHPVDRRSSHACTGLSAQARGILKRRNSSRGDAGPRDGHALARSLVSLEAGHRSGGEESDKNDVDLNERGDLADDEDGALEDQDEQQTTTRALPSTKTKPDIHTKQHRKKKSIHKKKNIFFGFQTCPPTCPPISIYIGLFL